MNKTMTARYLRLVLLLQAAFMLAHLIFALALREHNASRGFAAALAVSVVGALPLFSFKEEGGEAVYVKDGFVAVAVCWLGLSLVGALPFWISGEIPHFVDALFESVSGFTTTGASILPEVESLSKSILLWRSFTHWIGGMGVLVFLIALVPAISGGERTVNVMRAESPGPAPGKLVPKLRQSSKILYLIYFSLTILMLVLLLAGGMPLFDSVVNALGTAGTGGFGVRNESIASYGSLYSEIVITIFMILFGINFNMYYFVLVRSFRSVYKSQELRAYLGIIGVSIALITLNITGTVYSTIGQSLRYSSFQVASIISSTGFSTADFSLWPTFSKAVLFILMFIGASAGSTGGGIKVARIIILFREAKRTLFRVSHPRSVEAVKLDGKIVEKEVVLSVNTYFTSFMLLFFISFLIVSWDGFDFESTISAVIACQNNIGPGVGSMIGGPAGNFSGFSVLSKLVLSLDMLLGRLELYPVLLLFSSRTWRRV